MIEFSVPGEAKSERKRQRFVKTKTGATIGHRTDEPDRADFKSRIAYFAAQHFTEPLTGPVSVQIAVFKPVPPSWPKRPTNGNPWPTHWWKKPDAENFSKIVCDALTGIAWQDDAQIVDLHVSKRFGDRHETVVRIGSAVEEIGGAS